MASVLIVGGDVRCLRGAGLRAAAEIRGSGPTGAGGDSQGREKVRTVFAGGHDCVR